MLLAILLAIEIRGEPYSVELRTSRPQTCLLSNQATKSWAFAPKRLNPWQLRAGDIDGNGKMDFMVGVFKSTNLIKEPHRTIFFYEFNGEAVVPKWKASTLGRDLVDFNFALLEGPRVISIEKDLDGNQVLAEWRWQGFGLRKVADLAKGKRIRFEQLPWPERAIVTNVDGKTLTWLRQSKSR